MVPIAQVSSERATRWHKDRGEAGWRSEARSQRLSNTHTCAIPCSSPRPEMLPKPINSLTPESHPDYLLYVGYRRFRLEGPRHLPGLLLRFLQRQALAPRSKAYY